MAAISDTRLSVDMTRAMGRSLVRAGVNAQLETNHLAANDQAALVTCRSCQGQAVVEVMEGENIAGTVPTRPVQEQSSNGEEAKVRPTASNGRGPSPYVTIGEKLQTFLKSQGLTSGHDWTSLAQKTKEAYEIAADYFIDMVEFDYGSKRGMSDELAAAREQLDRITKALVEAGAPQNCDAATAIQRLAETHRQCIDEHRRERDNADKGFDNILAALKESGAVVDYGNPLQAAKDIVSEYRAMCKHVTAMTDILQEVRDELGEAPMLDISNMETASAAKRVVEMLMQHKASVDEVRREAALGTMRQIQAYIKTAMQHVQPSETP